MVVNIADKAEQRYDGDVCVAPVENLIRIVGNQDAGLYPEFGEIADVHTDNFRVHIDRANDLRAVFVEIPQGVLCHFTAAILHNFDLIHKTTSFIPCIVFPAGVLIIN